MTDTFGFRLGVEGEKDFKKALADINQTYKVLGSEMKLVASQFEKNDNSIEALSARNEVLNKQIDVQKGKIETLRDALKNASESFGDNDKRTKNWQIQLNNAEAALNDMERELKDNKTQMTKVGDTADKMGDEIEESGKKAERSTGRFDGLKSALTAASAAMGAVAAAAGAAAIKLGKEVVTAYSDYEQLVGGVQTLFSSASREVEANANKAYLSAGLSANEYMETVTSFSASLIQSLGGDTAKAAKLADQAIIDMSDNANKMGTDMASIQNAYQGFAKQNYSMLDNLKLGYGGTQKEMYRLLLDAAKIDKSFASTAKFSMDTKGQLTADYADIVQAIHIVQDEMGISGTTAEEAQKTISGSINSTKAAFQNLIAGLGDDSANIEQRVNALALSIKDVLTNVEPVIENLVAAIPTAAKTLFGSISKLLPTVLEAVTSIASALLEEAPAILEDLFSGISDLLPGILDFVFEDLLPNFVTSLLSIGKQLITSLSEQLPTLLPQIATAIVDLLNELFSPENITSMVEVFITLIKNIVAGLKDALPILIQGVFTLITGIVEALPDIIKMIVDALPDLIKMIVSAIVESIPALIEGVIQLIIGLVEALPDIITAIIEALPDIITSIVDALIDCLPQLIEGSITLTIELVKHLPEIILALIEAIPQIISAIVDAFSECIGPLIEVGGNMIAGLWEGIKNAGAWLWENISGFFSDIWDGIKDFFGIHSPSTRMRDIIGKNLVKGLAEGITDEGKTAVNAMTALSKNLSAVTFSPISFKGITDDLSNAIPADFDSQMRASVLTVSQYDGGASARPTSQVFNTPVHVTFGNVTINDGSDVEDIAHRVSDIIVNDVMVQGGAFA